MISRTFAVEKSIQGDPRVAEIVGQYKGFDRQLENRPAFVVIVYVDGEYDLWALDDNGPAVMELRRYYADSGEDRIVQAMRIGAMTEVLP